MRIRTLTVLITLLVGTCTFAQAQTKPMLIEVFPFELEDKSAGAGIIPPDEHDRRYLSESAQMAKDMLSQSGRFTVVDAPAGDMPAVAPHGLRNCGGCEGKIAKEHGASLALLGVVTRVNRTEHTMFIRILDAETGKPVSQGFTDLRMGANYAWPRSVKWLMTNRILR
ncbi:DUF2380 domain-containing protein [Mesorhizobium sp.]|uniref:DUF2380 domain-containing protein n=1 Tax=Mesorhizobium sp. TaxID=1871066 RepID=UPI000FE4A6EE|nr:DUF2380 domain-containing protein [Mesorhizobium sp.]RWI13086.1 MAG: DUF2380 domain-containing protein [Mesorhizobium sp.]RWK45842.1 MAG: DUF2380 domain-containing protein [Mesorhizobium sp.]RWK89776.1 MAG: DUF2380 domain-containing protein [Mesorhizobium sp.]TIP58532.1 MAG: DUF2380 domain-containing protein [Mesorhizobium sp.]TIQ23324.1 MAG: DUF2380 domain-containing protein [Mesorhizobium sp.]